MVLGVGGGGGGASEFSWATLTTRVIIEEVISELGDHARHRANGSLSVLRRVLDERDDRASVEDFLDLRRHVPAEVVGADEVDGLGVLQSKDLPGVAREGRCRPTLAASGALVRAGKDGSSLRQ